MRITDCLDRHVQERPDAVSAVDGARQLTWKQLADSVDHVAKYLAQQGVCVGDRVALRGHDGAATLICALAVLRVGGVHAPVDHTLADSEIETLINTLQTPWRIDVPRSTNVDQIVTIPITATTCARGADPLGAGNSAFLRLSSGTTGAAKGVLISHNSLCERISAANKGLRLTSNDRVLWLLPMAYHFAVSILLYLHYGVTLVFGNALRATSTAAIARDNQVTFAYGSPWHIRRLAELPAGHNLPATLTRVVSTTTALDATAAADFRARHGIGVCQGLGIIEIGLPFLSDGAVGEPPGDLGRALPDYRCAIIDDNNAVHEHGEGELAIAGPGLCDAYVSPWRPRDMILWQGYFRTGDRVSLSAPGHTHGHVRLLGRIKDVINVGGVKVFPLEVESVLDAHPSVIASRVRSAPDPRLGEQVHAEVQLRPDVARATIIQELQAWCSERLAPLKRPADFTIVEQLAMTASGKVRR
jgi:long-chain acyl-CoA synthetase